MSQQQTVLRVQTNNDSVLPQYEFLDLYSDIPIKLNKSFAELQDIGKKNTDYTIGLTIPGSKKNNRFFENFYNVDTASLYFNATKRNNCDVLLGDEPLFRGYLKLNKVSVMNSKIEYDVTLYSTVSNLFGAIGNNLLKDLDYNDSEYHFNHIFNLSNVTQQFNYSNFSIDGEKPYPYFYPVVHNGYEYLSGSTVNLSGTTISQTRYYTSTSPINSYATPAAAWAAGVKQYQINSPTQGLINNQLKPALNMWSLMKLIFKNYGYTITSDFFNTPWMKSLYMYGYFSSEGTKFSYKLNNIEQLSLSGVEVIFFVDGWNVSAVVCKLGTGIPCYCLSDINVTMRWVDDTVASYTIPALLSGITETYTDVAFDFGTSTDVTVSPGPLQYLPIPVGTAINFEDGDPVNFSLVIDEKIKQIDIIASLAKKFNLVFISNPDSPNEIKIEPYDFYVGTGDIYDWTDKISYDKGWEVQPAINFVESELFLSDLEDNDEGNKQFKQRNNRIYGQENYYGKTDFKSQEKKIETIFSPELIRKWDDVANDNIGVPLGINYVANNQPVEGNNAVVDWLYKGIKTKPKLFFWLGGFNPFLDKVGETYDASKAYKTYNVYVSDSNAAFYFQSDKLPIISHTMPMGVADRDKINNDSLCVLFNSEYPTNIEGTIQTYNTYTENDAFNKFYNNRITNIYDSNTRFLSGYFNLKYSDVKNLKPNDIIKIQEQYFTWNKINEFNLTNRELTKLELIQFNVTPQTYPDRYFAYSYCDRPGTCYKLKTDFTNPNLLDSNFGWSVYYDHQVGSLTGQTSGFTSAFVDVVNFSTIKYVPYSMYEITETEYNNNTCLDWSEDTLIDYIYSQNGAFSSFYMPTFWTNSGTTRQGVNVFYNCQDFANTATTWGILTGSSTSHGIQPTPTPSPSPTPLPPTPTPSPTPTPLPDFDGKYMIAGDNYEYIYNSSRLGFSSNSGSTFNIQARVNDAKITGVAVSTDGSISYFSNYANGVYKSTDYGSTYNLLESIPAIPSFPSALDASSNGDQLVYSSGNGTYYSNNYGNSFTTVGDSNYFRRLKMNNKGFPIYGVEVIDGATFIQPMKLSSVSSTFTYISSLPLDRYMDFAASQNDQYQLAIARNNNLYLSTNSGTTFTNIASRITGTTYFYGTSVAMSATGQYMLMATRWYDNQNLASVWRSIDYGTTWQKVVTYNTFGQFYPDYISMSSDGQNAILSLTDPFEYVATYSGLLISNNYGATWTEKNAGTRDWGPTGISKKII